MAVVRTLTTNLDFNVDFTAINQFTKSIKDFKLNFLIGSLAAADFARRVVGAVTEVAHLIRDTRELSATTGIAFENLYKLSQAAKGVGLDENLFGNILVNLQRQILDASYAIGPLYEFIRDNENANFAVLDNLGNPRPVLEVLQDVISALNKIDNQQQRIDFIGKLFDRNSAARLDKFFSGVGGDINAIISSESITATQIAQAEAFGDKFLDSLQAIFSSFEVVIQNFVIKFSPLILTLTSVLNLILEAYNKFSQGIDKFVDKSATGIRSGFSAFGGSLMRETDLSDIYDPYDPNDRYTPPVTIQNNIEVNMPEGSDAEQGRVMAESAKNAYVRAVEYLVRQLQLNNPQVE